jgi:hypothetical protein
MIPLIFHIESHCNDRFLPGESFDARRNAATRDDTNSARNNSLLQSFLLFLLRHSAAQVGGMTALFGE